MDRVWLHRTNRRSWMFEPSKKYGELVHITNRGTVYAIISDHKIGRPFWVARLSDDGRSWFTVERELSAESIEFEGEGRYVFENKGD